MMQNPLLRKEFRQRMRTTRAPVVITGYFISMALFTFFLLHENVQGQLSLLLPAKGEQVFVTLSLVQMTVAVFLTPAFAAGAISGERERRTLAVLLTTPLSPIGILVGKILSSSALLVLLLVVSLPLYSLVFLFGGAVPSEVIAVFAFQLYTIVVIAAFSVIWSTLALRSGWSTVWSYGTVAWMTIGTGVVGYGFQFVAGKYQIDYFLFGWGKMLLSLNPLWVEATMENAAPTSASYAWVIFVCAYGGLCILLALPCIWRLRPQSFRLWPRRLKSDERNYQ
jgi:ABC-type transport system involved in multi-copper enzyme maturation permease subunit